MVEVPEIILGIKLPKSFGMKMVINGLSALPIESPPDIVQVCLI